MATLKRSSVHRTAWCSQVPFTATNEQRILTKRVRGTFRKAREWGERVNISIMTIVIMRLENVRMKYEGCPRICQMNLKRFLKLLLQKCCYCIGAVSVYNFIWERWGGEEGGARVQFFNKLCEICSSRAFRGSFPCVLSSSSKQGSRQEHCRRLGIFCALLDN